jgi:chromosome partitioning protein
MARIGHHLSTDMKSLSLVAQKGGAGKTTLAAHLVVYAAMRGEKVALIDTDPQRSTAEWWRARGITRPAMAECNITALANALNAARQRGFTLVIVDNQPRADRALYLVAETVDFSLIPCRPGPMDLRALSRTVDIIDLLSAPAGIVLNAVPAPRGDQEVSITRKARESMRHFNLPVAPGAITQRDILAHPIPDGRAYIELYPDGKPSQEIGQLRRWVSAQLLADHHDRDDELHPDPPVRPTNRLGGFEVYRGCRANHAVTRPAFDSNASAVKVPAKISRGLAASSAPRARAMEYQKCASLESGVPP